jgi:dTDP-glucose 4,6-dehydratase
MDATKIRRELGFCPAVSLQEGLRRTVRWYLDAKDWLDEVRSGAYREFESLWYGQHLRGLRQDGQS